MSHFRETSEAGLWSVFQGLLNFLEAMVFRGVLESNLPGNLRKIHGMALVGDTGKLGEKN